MSKIVLATFGSLGDLHPMLAIGKELKARGHGVTVAAMETYRDRIEPLGLGFSPMAPHVNPDDRELVREMMHERRGSEKIIRELILGNIRPMYVDLMRAIEGADILVTGEVVYAVKSAVDKTGIKWISTGLQPGVFFSAYDPVVPPVAQFFKHLRFLGPRFYSGFFKVMRWHIRDWLEPYREFRRELGLDEDHDPIVDGKYSPLVHLALFSRMLGAPQPDWPPNVVQPGFCFYDGADDLQKMPQALNEFLDAGEPPIVFTLGSAAVMDPGDFFDESIKAANILKRRAVLLYGVYNTPPVGLTDNIVGFDYAPFSQLFPRAACVVHQGGVGTTGQVLRAGVPHLIMPYAHDQPDNAARCVRLGVAEEISRSSYTGESAARKLSKIFSKDSYAENAARCGKVVRSEGGTTAACDEIESHLNRSRRP